MSDEWRVEVELDDDERGYGFGERLRSLDLDDAARERLGKQVIVTRDGSHLFLYTASEHQAREAERVVGELLSADRLTGAVSVTRWHEIEEAWKDASIPLPETEAERAAEAAANEAAEIQQAVQTGEYDWEVRIDTQSLAQARHLAHRLRDEGLPVHRGFHHVLVGVLTEEQGAELAERVRGEAPEGAPVTVVANLRSLPVPAFVLLGDAKPRIARDLGL